MRHLPEKFLCFLIGGYRVLISPLKPSCCRYIPTCSEYAREALRVHGAMRGACLAFRRILRCHPFGKSGWDPVPPASGHCSCHPKQ